MQKLLLSLFVACVSATWASAFTYTGTMTIQFGGYWDGGRYVDLSGTKIPFVAEYIGPPSRLGRVATFGRSWRMPGGEGMRLLGGGGDANITIYRNNNGAGSYFHSSPQFPIPSCLDDIRIISSGVNRQWKTLTIGIHAETTNTFLIRWKVYWQYQTGLGRGQQAFFPDPPAPNRDFGGYFSVPTPGTYAVTFNIAGVGCNVPQQQAYVAQQFRWPQFPERGEGPFAQGAVQSIFSGFGATVGSSDNVFWYDWDPVDGIYDETEVDYFGTAPGEEANLLFVITAAEGTTETALPTSFTVQAGVLVSGNVGSLWFDDANRLVVREAPPLALGLPSVRVMIEGGIAPGAVAGFQFNLISRVPIVGTGVTQRIDLFNFSTNQWVQFDTRPGTTSDSLVQIVVPNNPQQYISPTNQMRARISYFDPGTLVIFGWRAELNLANWIINRP